MFSVVAVLVDATPKNSFKVSINDDLLCRLKESYASNPWCKKLMSASQGMAGVMNQGSLWYIGQQLVVSKESGVHELIYQVTHDCLGSLSAMIIYKSHIFGQICIGIWRENTYLDVRIANNSSLELQSLADLCIPFQCQMVDANPLP